MQRLIILNRTRERAEALADTLVVHHRSRITLSDWDTRTEALRGATLLANTTSLGMRGQLPLELELSHLPPTAAVTELAYTPRQTDLLARAAAHGCRTVDGLGMLIHQARPGFAAWFGREPEVDAGVWQLLSE